MKDMKRFFLLLVVLFGMFLPQTMMSFCSTRD